MTMRYKIMKCPIDAKDNPFTLMISLKTATELNLNNGSNVNLQCGIQDTNATVSIVSESDLRDETLWLTEDILNKLLIPDNIEIGVKTMGHGNIIKFGPIIGVLTDDAILKSHKKGLSTREAFNLYAEAGNEIGGLIYVFSLKNIDLDNKRILGYVALINDSASITWREQWLPIPDAIHNRIKVSPSDSEYEKINSLIKIYPNMIIINRVTRIYKWAMQKMLVKDHELEKYLPKTVLFKGINTLNKMLQEFPFVYLKPTGRSLGVGIIKIEKCGLDKYTAQYHDDSKQLYSLSGNLTDILSKLKKVMGTRTHIVQEGISLATYNGNIFDLRISVQKDGTGAWGLSRWKVRVAAPNDIVTNISSGGSGARIDQVLNSVFKEKADEIMKEIKIASLTICKAIDNKVNGIGDIGLDIGISNSGKIYFIEANFRELRLNGGSAENTEDWKNTFKKPIYYLNYLYEEFHI